MKTFACAIIAASATAFEAVSVPEFIAGFMYGMTGDNHLAEIEACYQGGEQIVTDSELAIADFKAGSYVKGIKDAGTVWNEVGASMTTCKGMDEDVAAIEAWAKIFTEPATLSKTVAKHWLFHGSQIKADLAKEESDWSTSKYFDAGKDVADALTLAVGPIASNEVANLNIKAPIEFVGGLLEGLVGESHLDEITTCFTDGDAVVDDISAIVEEIEAGKWIAGAEGIKGAMAAFSTALGACESIGPDVKAIESWATVFETPKTVVSDITKAMLMHHKAITGDISTIKTDWATEKYFDAGKTAADLLVVALGPVPAPALNEAAQNFDLLEIPELAAGFIYGMVGDNHLAEMQACYSSTHDLEQYLATAVKDVEAFHLFSAMKQFEEFVYHFQVDVAPCMNMSEDVAAIELWAKAFTNPKTLVADATKHYLLHKKAVTTDITAIKTDFAAKSYFAAGKDAADILTILVGSIE